MSNSILINTAPLSFVYVQLTGVDSEKFLQGQVTCDVKKLTDRYTPCAICNLKGRVQFGLWLNRIDDGFGIVLSLDLLEEFKAHIKKYGAFSKINLSEPKAIYPVVANDEPTFDFVNHNQQNDWQKLSIETGNYWITKATSELFQPQELRLHQRGGVAYDKGCYLGQEIVARLYFKASPKAYLHRVAYQGDSPKVDELTDKIMVVNSLLLDGTWQALVVARPEEIEQSGLTVLPLPKALQENVGRV